MHDISQLTLMLILSKKDRVIPGHWSDDDKATLGHGVQEDCVPAHTICVSLKWSSKNRPRPPIHQT